MVAAVLAATDEVEPLPVDGVAGVIVLPPFLTKELARLSRSHRYRWPSLYFPQGGRGSWGMGRGLCSHLPYIGTQVPGKY